ncbi:unnamed protein product [Callosobruchus maculatus]|uniref:Inositol polyphosphate 1-phosphatase n=1 Tax=Callosobruchus maculatus TaxID=64391 RepID=A0A653DD60_CALMS|nr:unnamed protein product [Callosobruchus maculatus]
MDLLKSLIILSEKAANIARACRADQHLFGLLVQQKKEDEANPRFVEDFKTLADVLIQEMVRYYVGMQFQDLSDSVKGEENNTFTNKLGEKICVQVEETEEKTAHLLKRVLSGDQLAANLLAAEVHKEIDLKDVDTNIPSTDFEVDLHDLAIWIDPIDCTAEYIHGGQGEVDSGIYKNGLQCVTILIGVYSKSKHTPVIGIVNRPFLEKTSDRSGQQCIWGVCLPNLSLTSIEVHSNRRNIICLSSSESQTVKQKLIEKGFQLVEASGAGYKIMTVILGLSDVYLLTKGTTYKWDTCAPHAILKSMGGDVLDFLDSVISEECSIDYSTKGPNCNTNGIIAYRDRETVEQVLEIMKM